MSRHRGDVERSKCHTRILEVKNDYDNALEIVRSLGGMVGRRPNLLKGTNLTKADLSAFEAELPELYLMKLWAVFESILRQYSVRGNPKKARRTRSNPPTQRGINAESLVNQIA